MPMITPSVMERTLCADYEEIERRNDQLLAGHGKVRISSPSGTDLSFSVEGRPLHADGGINHHTGDFVNLPAGEFYAAPVEGTTEGRLLVDGSMAGVGLLEDPIELVIEGGLAVKILGVEKTEELERLITPHGGDVRNIAELGIGTNEMEIISGNILEDEVGSHSDSRCNKKAADDKSAAFSYTWDSRTAS